MREFTVVREVPHTPQETWDRLTAWERHGELVPLTRVSRTAEGIVARTAIGPLGFDDPMRIVEEQPPVSCRLVKTGQLVRGDVDVRLQALDGGTRVTWVERIAIRGLPRWFDPLVAVAGRRMFGRVIDGLLA